MSTTTIIIIVVLAVVLIAVAVFSKHSKHKYVFHQDQVATAINKVFEEAGTNELPRKKFQHLLQLKLNCSQKELFFLFGKARTLGMIDVDGDNIKAK